ncbi:hypothetical protein POJ06DRAFT_255108, partial [Lipomyces tetrasporus]
MRLRFHVALFRSSCLLRANSFLVCGAAVDPRISFTDGLLCTGTCHPQNSSPIPSHSGPLKPYLPRCSVVIPRSRTSSSYLKLVSCVDDVPAIF